MKLQLVRNATMRIHFASVAFVTDPLLSKKLTMPSYAGKSKNPLVDLPIPPEEVLVGAQMLLLSHLHSDHFDKTAQQLVSKEMRILCQPSDLHRLQVLGFRNVQPVETELSYKGIKITRTAGRHGSDDAVLQEMGSVSGYILETPGEPAVYWVGDSVLYEEILRTIDTCKPKVIITHSSGAVWGKTRDLIVMDAPQTVEVCHYCPGSTIVAIHLDSLDHGTVTRNDLAKAREAAHIHPGALRIPQDGEIIAL